MGYIKINGGIPNFSKAIISLWFRIPTEAQDAAMERSDSATEDQPFAWDAIIPLVVMGKTGKQDPDYTLDRHNVVEWKLHIWDVAGLGNDGPHVTDITTTPPPYIIGRAHSEFTYNPGGHFVNVDADGNQIQVAIPSFDSEGLPKPPTYIGVDAYGNLLVNFETGKAADVENYNIFLQGVTPGHDYTHSGFTYTGGVPSVGTLDDAFPVGTYIYEYDFAFSTGIDVGNEVVLENTTRWQQWPPDAAPDIDPVYDYVDRSPDLDTDTGAIYSDSIEYEPDVWHHVLISLDFTDVKTRGFADFREEYDPQSQYVEAAAKLYVALDDVNYTGWQMSSNCFSTSVDDHVGSGNDVLTDKAYEVIWSGPNEEDSEGTNAPPRYSLESPEIPADAGPLGFPATPEFIDDIYRVEMAEFQMWTGISFDTAVEANRRAFIDYTRDKDGHPIPDKDGNFTLKPVSMAKAEELLGKRPEIILHGTGNWKTGKNTGSLGINNKGEIIPSGQFEPTGTIKAYKPDPSITPPPAPATAMAVEIRVKGPPA